MRVRVCVCEVLTGTWAAYVDPQFFYETVAPLLSVGATTLIGISTLTSEINFYSESLLCCLSCGELD